MERDERRNEGSIAVSRRRRVVLTEINHAVPRRRRVGFTRINHAVEASGIDPNKFNIAVAGRRRGRKVMAWMEGLTKPDQHEDKERGILH